MHKKCKEEQDLLCSFELSFEINQIRVTLFEGKDFDFDNSEARSVSQSGLKHLDQE